MELTLRERSLRLNYKDPLGIQFYITYTLNHF